MPREPGGGGATNTALLLGGHHLERVAEPLAALRLHLAEHDHAAAADDEVELVAGEPAVRVEDPVEARAAHCPCRRYASSGRYARARHERRWISHGPRSRTMRVWSGVM